MKLKPTRGPASVLVVDAAQNRLPISCPDFWFSSAQEFVPPAPVFKKCAQPLHDALPLFAT